MSQVHTVRQIRNGIHLHPWLHEVLDWNEAKMKGRVSDSDKSLRTAIPWPKVDHSETYMIDIESSRQLHF